MKFKDYSHKKGLLFAFFFFIGINSLNFNQMKISNIIGYFPSPTDLISEVNALRASNGLYPYSINSILLNVAQAHSDYQASIGSVTHYSADGSRPFQRALAAGYQVAGDLSQGGFFSENITAGTNLSVSEAVISWQQDAPHLNTMLSSIHQDIGAGVTIVGEKIYYTIDVGLSSDYQATTYPTDQSEALPSNNNVYSNPILTSTPDQSGAIIHTVNLGETIWVISQIYNVPEDEIRNLNGLTGDYIFVGDQLLIQTGTPSTPTKTSTLLSSTPVETSTLSIEPTFGITTSPVSDGNLDSSTETVTNWILVFPLALFILISIFAIYRIRYNN